MMNSVCWNCQGGRCAQDECYIESVSEDEIYEKMQDRFGKKVKNAVPLENYDILLFFENDMVKKCSLTETLSENFP